MKIWIFLIITLFLLTVQISSCAPIGLTNEEHGFLNGLIHGFCLPFSLVGKLFGLEVALIAENNSGVLYFTGIVFGLRALLYLISVKKF